jgi:hypothetical protein
MENGKKILNNQNNIIEEQVVKYLIELSSVSTGQNYLLPEKKITIINSKQNQILNPEDDSNNNSDNDSGNDLLIEKIKQITRGKKEISDYYSGCKYSSFGKDDLLNSKDDFLNCKKVEEVDSLINNDPIKDLKDINSFDKNLMKNKMLIQKVDNFINNQFQKTKHKYYEKPILKSSFVPELNINEKIGNKFYSDKYKNQLIEDIFKSINRLEIILKNYKP